MAETLASDVAIARLLQKLRTNEGGSPFSALEPLKEDDETEGKGEHVRQVD
jgi:hypothetical protein